MKRMTSGVYERHIGASRLLCVASVCASIFIALLLGCDSARETEGTTPSDPREPPSQETSVADDRGAVPSESHESSTQRSFSPVNRALIVGASKYMFGFADLPGVKEDVVAMKAELPKLGFRDEHIRVLFHDEEQPTREAILKAFGETIEACGKDDVLFVMFSGHGFQSPDGKKELFVPCDGRPHRNKSGEIDGCLNNTSVSLNDIVKRMEECPARSKILIVDACREDGHSRGLGPSVDTLGDLSGNGFLILRSCGPDEKSYEDAFDDGKHGIFTYKFLEGLRGAAINIGNGGVSAYEAFKYASKETVDLSNDQQHPRITSKDYWDFPLVKIEAWRQAAVERNEALDAERDGDRQTALKRIRTALQLAIPEPMRKACEEIEKRLEQAVGWTIDKPGTEKSLTIDEREFRFRSCPAGDFMMGSDKNEQGRRDLRCDREMLELLREEGFDDDSIANWETAHKTTLTQGFWCAEIETPQWLWRFVANASPIEFGGDDLPVESVNASSIEFGGDDLPVESVNASPSEFRGDDLPVESVSWVDCVAFVARLNKLNIAPIGWKFSLPTEAQFERAARADSKTPFPWGDALNGDKANCDGNYPCGTSVKGEYVGVTTKGRGYPSNEWGICDVSGNVAEWTLDAFAPFSEADVKDPCVKEGDKRVARGGSWYSEACDCRCASRDPREPDRRSPKIGCRLVLVRDESSEDKEE